MSQQSARCGYLGSGSPRLHADPGDCTPCPRHRGSPRGGLASWFAHAHPDPRRTASACFSPPVICLILPQAVDYLGSSTMLTGSWRSVHVPAGLRSRAHPGASQALMLSARPPCPGAAARALLGFRGAGRSGGEGAAPRTRPCWRVAAAAHTRLRSRAHLPGRSSRALSSLFGLRSLLFLIGRVLYLSGVRVLPGTQNSSPLCGCLCILLMTF